MAKLNLSKSYIPLTIEFDDESEVTVKLDVKERGLYRKIQTLLKYEKKYRSLAQKLQAATEDDDAFLTTMAAGDLAMEMAQVLKDGIVLFADEDAYEAILEGLGDGEKIPPEDANFAMIEVFMEIEGLILDHFNNHSNALNSYADKMAHYRQEIDQSKIITPAFANTAAHSTAEVEHAQPDAHQG